MRQILDSAEQPKSARSPSPVRDSARSDMTYKVHIESDNLTRLVFQPAQVKKHQYLMVTLMTKKSVIDRKILPIDLYYSTTALDMYDPELFVREHIMPCIKTNKKTIELDESKLKSS